MKLGKQKKIEPKTRAEITQEIEDIFAKKINTKRAKMLRKASTALRSLKSQEEIKELFVEEYVKKYGELSSGKTTVEELKKSSVQDAKQAQGK